jgi:tetraacyldisaccharide 4'-kinase
MRNLLLQQWYNPKPWGWLLWPFAQVFSSLVSLRRFCYRKNIFNVYHASVPVIIIGNITVGGTGKTPLVMYFAKLLQQQGYNPGIITRGYKGKIRTAALVHPNADPLLVGDEAVLMAKDCSCPVMISKNRSIGVQALVQHHKVDIILSDDGLQHYALGRDIEIAVIDGQRRFGNGYSLPMGPLREMPSRLNSVDLTVVNGSDMNIICDGAYMLQDRDKSVALDSLVGKTVHAIAGIGNPQQYFKQLREFGIIIIEHVFPDHYFFRAQDITFADALPVLMTEKDAVKCRAFAKPQHWVVSTRVVVADTIVNKFGDLVKGVLNGRSKTIGDPSLSYL